MANEEIENGPERPNALSLIPAASPLHAPAAPALKRPIPRRGRGKVARLPLQVRNLVNQSLRDGLPYAEISGLLAARGFPGVAPAHLGSWARGGYRQWLTQQERFELSALRSDRAAALLGSLREDGRSDLADLNASILSAQFLDLLENVDQSNLRQLLADNPEDYFRLTKTVTALDIARSNHQEIELSNASNTNSKSVKSRNAKPAASNPRKSPPKSKPASTPPSNSYDPRQR